MEFLLCLWLAAVITGFRPISDLIHLAKGQEPPHLTKARLRADAQQQKAAARQAAAENRPVRPGEDKPTLGDLARVYWGNAMDDAIDASERRHAEKKAQRQNAAGTDSQQAPARPSRGGRARRLWSLIWNGPQPRTTEGVDVAKAVDDALSTDTVGNGPRIACDACGATLVDTAGGYAHPAGSTCPTATKATTKQPAPTLKDTRWDCPGCGMLLRSDDPVDEGRNCRSCTADTTALPGNEPVAPDLETLPAPPWSLLADDQPTEGEPMSETATAPTATGDAHDVESAIHECGLLDDDLTRIDTALDVIDEAITSAGQAAERIEAFLASKNVDDSAVGGMSVARDMLSPTHIKALIDAVAAAKVGVQAASQELQRLQDLEQQLNGADGSVLNGR